LFRLQEVEVEELKATDAAAGRSRGAMVQTPLIAVCKPISGTSA
jgi:hypothetical protein